MAAIWAHDHDDRIIALWLIFIPVNIFLVILLIFIVHNMVSKGKQHQRHELRARITGIVCILLYCASTILHYYAELTVHGNDYSARHRRLYLTSSILFILANAVTFSIFLQRLQLTLTGTAYQPSTLLRVACYVLCALYVAAGVVSRLYARHIESLSIAYFAAHVVLSIWFIAVCMQKLILLSTSVAFDLEIGAMPSADLHLSGVRQKPPQKWSINAMSLPYESTISTRHDSNAKDPAFDLFSSIQPPKKISNVNVNVNANMNVGHHKRRSTFQRLNELHLITERTDWLQLTIKLSIVAVCSLSMTDVWNAFVVTRHHTRCDTETCDDAWHFISAILMSVICVINASMTFLTFEFSEKIYKRCCYACERCCNLCCNRFTRAGNINEWAEKNMDKALDVYLAQHRAEVDAQEYTELSEVLQL